MKIYKKLFSIVALVAIAPVIAFADAEKGLVTSEPQVESTENKLPISPTALDGGNGQSPIESSEKMASKKHKPPTLTGIKKIQAYFNEGIEEDAENRVEIIDGRLVAVEASNSSGAHFIEDCRKVAIRQAILDATAEGLTVNELSRKNSHRISILEGSPTDNNDTVGAIVGMRTQAPSGTKIDVSYFYGLSDNSAGSCEWARTNSRDVGLSDRRATEEMVKTKLWPKMSEAHRDNSRKWMKNRFDTNNDDEVIQKGVGKLLEWDCEQHSINKAVQLSQAYFRSQFGEQPVTLLDFERSKLGSNVLEDQQGPGERKTKLKQLDGYFVFRMANAAGTNFAAAKVSFDLTEKNDKCSGSVDSEAKPFSLSKK